MANRPIGRGTLFSTLEEFRRVKWRIERTKKPIDTIALRYGRLRNAECEIGSQNTLENHVMPRWVNTGSALIVLAVVWACYQRIARIVVRCFVRRNNFPACLIIVRTCNPVRTPFGEQDDGEHGRDDRAESPLF